MLARLAAWTRIGREIMRANSHAPVRGVASAIRWRVLSALLPFYNPEFVLEDGLRVRCPRLSGSARRVAYYGGADANLRTLLDRYLRPGDRVLDVGANVGLVSLRAARIVGSSGRVVAFEGSPVTADVLEANVAANGLEKIVSVHRFAVGSERGVVAMTTGLDEVDHVAVDGDDVQRVEVPIVPLAEALSDERWALWKVDVEGMELDVLRGAEPLLARGAVDLIVLEVNGGLNRYGYRPEDIQVLLERHGYRCASLQGETLCYGGRLWDDILAVSQAREADVVARLGVTTTSQPATTWAP